MAKPTDFDLDDSGLDSFNFDFDDPFAEPKTKNDRKPITRVAINFANGAKDAAKSPSFYRGVLKKAMPKAYSDVLDDLDLVKRGAQELYNKSAKELAPSMRELKDALKDVVPKDGKYVPKSIKAWLASSDDTYKSMSEDQQREQQLELEMAGMFKTQLVENAKFQEETRRRESRRDVVNAKLTSQQLAVLDGIRTGVGRLVGYQDHITARYQRKSLELQYRHLFIAKDSLAEYKARTAETNVLLKDIIKNTGLPDIVKVHDRDAQRSTLRDKLMGKYKDKVSKSINDLVAKAQGNAETWIRDKISTFGGVTGMLGMGSGMGGGIGSLLSGAAGGITAEYLAGELAKLGMDKFSDPKKLRAATARIHLAHKNAISTVHDYADGKKKTEKVKNIYGDDAKHGDTVANHKGEKVKWNGYNHKAGPITRTENRRAGPIGLYDDVASSAKGFFKELFTGEGTDNFLRSMVGGLVGDRKNSNKIDFGFSRTGAEGTANASDVTNGFLSRILREVTVLSTGDAKVERIEFNHRKGAFTTVSGKRADVLARLKTEAGTRNTGIDLDNAVGAVGGDKLSAAAKAALKLQMLKNSSAGEGFHVEKYANADSYHESIDKKTRKELASHFKRTYKTNKANALGDDPDLDEAKNKAAEEYFRINTRRAEFMTSIDLMMRDGLAEDLQEMGLVRFVDGVPEIVEDAVEQLIIAAHFETQNGQPATFTPETKVAEATDRLDELAKLSRKKKAATAGYGSGSSSSGSSSSAEPADSTTEKLYKQYVGKATVYMEKAKEIFEKHSDEITSGAAGNKLRELYDTYMNKAQFYTSEAQRVMPSMAREAWGKIRSTASDIMSMDVKGAVSGLVDRVRPSTTPLPTATAAEISQARATSETNASDAAIADSGWHDQVIQLLTDQLEANRNSREILSNINEQLIQGIAVMSMNGGTMGADGVQRRWGLRHGIRSFAGKFMSATGTVVKAAGSVYGAIMGATAKAIKGAGSIAGGLLKFAGTKIAGLGRQGDIYVRGTKMPVLLGRDIKRGRYRDVTTGKIIKDILHIKGPVADLDNGERICISQEDFEKGLFDNRGVPILRQVTKFVLGAYGAVLSPVAGMLAVTGKVFGAIGKALLASPDVYVLGEKAPRLLAKLMASGVYFSDRTGRAIKHFKDIDGPVRDMNQNMVLTMEDINKGLVGPNGKPLKTKADHIVGAIKWVAGKAWGVAKAVYGYGAAVVKNTFKLTKFLVNGLGKFVGRGLGIVKPKSLEEATSINTYRSVEVLHQIRDILDERLPGKKRKKGGWQDKATERMEKAKSKVTGKIGEVAGKVKNGVVNKLGLGEKAATGAGEISALEAGAGGAAIGGVASKASSVLGRAAGWMGRGALAVGGAALEYGGVALALGAEAGAAALAGAGTVLAGAGALLTAPVILTGLAIAAVGVGGYFLYKWLKNRDKSELTNIRLLQYGVKPTEEARAKKVLGLESKLKDCVKFSGQNANIDIDKKLLLEVITDFGINPKDDKAVQVFIGWFDARFKPVFCRSWGALKAMGSDCKLEDVDTDLKNPEKLDYLSKITFQFDDASPYYSLINPFGEGEITVENTDIKAAFDDALAKFKDDGKGGSASKIADSAPVVNVNRALATGDQDEDMPTATGQMAESFDDDTVRTNSVSAAVGTATVKIVGGVGDLGGKRKGIEALDIVRLKAYGLVELDIDKVRALQVLEKELVPLLKFGGNGDATLDLIAENYLRKFGASFGVSGDVETDNDNWKSWFTQRFMPVFVGYASAIRKISQTADILNPTDMLTGEQILTIAQAVIGIKSPGRIWDTSIWKMDRSPWPGYKLNTDSRTTDNNINIIKNTAKQTKYVDTPSATDLKDKSSNSSDDKPKPATPAAPSKPYDDDSVRTNSQMPTATASAADNNAGTGTPPAGATTKPAPTTYAGAAAAGKSTGGSGGGMIMPTKGTISSPYGMRIHPVTGVAKFHHGVDIAAPSGTPIMAAADGVIIRRERTEDYGNVIYIKHNDGRVSRYGHMSEFQPGYQVGSTVKQGMVIGYVGTTGRSTGNHLHFEIRDSDSPTAQTTDPMKVLNGETATAAASKLKDDTAAATAAAKPPTDGPSLEGVDTVASTVTGKATQPAVAVEPVANKATPSASVVDNITGNMLNTATQPNPTVNASAAGDTVASAPAPAAAKPTPGTVTAMADATKQDQAIAGAQSARSQSVATSMASSQQSNADLNVSVRNMADMIRQTVTLQTQMAASLVRIEANTARNSQGGSASNATPEAPKPGQKDSSGSPVKKASEMARSPISMDRKIK